MPVRKKEDYSYTSDRYLELYSRSSVIPVIDTTVMVYFPKTYNNIKIGKTWKHPSFKKSLSMIVIANQLNVSRLDVRPKMTKKT